MTVSLFALLLGVSSYGALRLVNRTEALSLDHRILMGLAATVSVAGCFILQAQTIWTLILLTLLIMIAVTDARTHLLPDWLMALFIAVGLAHCGFAFLTVIGVVLCVLCAMANTLMTQDKGMIGTADYLLCSGLVAWVGPQLALDALVIALIVFGLQIIITHQRCAAFGPAVAAGLTAIWFGGPIL